MDDEHTSKHMFDDHATECVGSDLGNIDQATYVAVIDTRDNSADMASSVYLPS